MQSIVLFKNNGQSKGDSPNYNGCLGIDVKRMVQGCGSQVDALGLVKYYFNTHRGLQRRKDQILDVTVHDRVMAHMIDCMNDVNQPVQGWSLLTLALFHGSLRIADVLLAKGATMKLEQLEQNLNGVIGLFGNDAEPLVASVLRLCDVKCISFLEKTLYRMERRRCYPRMVFKVDFYPRVRKCIEDKLSELKALASGDLSQSLCA
jgi:hypothetical protein